MRSVSPLAAAIAALAVRGVAGQYDDWKFGNLFIAGPAKSAIKKATYTLTPPPVPCGTQVDDPSHQPWMSIWVGISESIGDQSSDLFQPLLNWAPNNEQEGCPAPNDAWCVAASTFDSGNQVAQPYVAIPNGASVGFEITYDGSAVTQVVSINGEVVSQQTDRGTGAQTPNYIYSSNECYLGACGTIQQYSWDDFTVELEQADPNFGNTLTVNGGDSTGLTTSDGGKTWHADSIVIAKDYFYTDGSKKECS
ncbi:hypothetical protein CEP54_011384 [Fusarium duplospermum]|uniref:Concanavalin A-like lectin/glucanase n=1 Tax=Fusarium duplospermum TaxID=1325734 RepID=A0A428PEL0_9HYPO|nr:hypothetical protein CEP54_011384 [Fusarium duplospermum]